VKLAKRSTYLKISAAAIGVVMLLFFNNCKGKSDGAIELQSLGASTSDSTTGNGGTGSGLCEQDLKNLFDRGWHKFLQTNCAICHSNGPGKGRFANSDLNIAYTDFMAVGFTKVSNNAVSPTHNPPYSGVQNTEAVNTLKVEWQNGLTENAKCTGDTSLLPVESQADKISLKTSEQVIGLAKDGDKKVITWTINSDLTRVKGTDPLPNIPGGKIAITVTRLTNSSGATYYDFSVPTLYGASVDTRVQGIFVNLNGFLLNYPTTFSYVDKSIRQGSMNDVTGLISIGTLVAPKVILSTDTVSLSFINITQVILPPPPAPITVSLVNATTTVVPKGTDYVDVTVALSAPAAEPVVVTLTENNDLCGTAATYNNSNTLFKTISSTCLKDVYDFVCPGGSCVAAAKDFGRAKSNIGTTWNRFDWDYKFPVNSVTFNVGESSKSVRVTFSKNIRYEKNRLLTLDISSALGSVVLGAKKTANFVINKYDNPVPNDSILTFSELMDPQSGILGQNCVKCHNSATLAGGYDMTDYDWMIRNRVVIPNDITSKMYARMHDTGNSLLKPMPFDGFLPAPQVLEVERWLLNGALNN